MRYYPYPLLPALLLFGASAQAQGDSPARDIRAGCRGDPLLSTSGASPVAREAFDAAVTANFAAADRDHDGGLTLAEAHAATRACRDAEVASRFARIDSNDDGTISRNEFAAWEHRGDRAPRPPFEQPSKGVGMAGEPFALDEGAGWGLIHRRSLVEPVGAATVAVADADGDGALTLSELLAYQAARFDAADHDRDGEISPEEWPAPPRFRRTLGDREPPDEAGPPAGVRVPQVP